MLILTVAAGISGFLGWFLGGLDGLVYALITMMVIDYITGIKRAILEKRLCSAIGARGIFKKSMILLLVGVANIIDKYLLQEDTLAVRSVIILFYIANEGISILDNATALGLPVPKKLKEVLAQFHKEEC